jgi:flagellar protein FliS
MLAQYARAYKSVAVRTASPGHLVLMLFDGALRFVTAALQGFEIENVGQRFEQIHNNAIKTQNILRELQVSLDMKVGGEFSQRMHALYEYMLEQIIAANMKKDPEPLRIVEKLLTEIRDAWAQMLEQNVSQAA